MINQKHNNIITTAAAAKKGSQKHDKDCVTTTAKYDGLIFM